MLKSIFSISIMAAIGLLIFALALPNQADQLAHQVLGKAITLDTASIITSPITAVSNSVSTIIKNRTTAVVDNSPLSAANIVDATNVQRVQAGLSPLKTNDQLMASAKLKVEDMIANHYFEHTSPSGKTVADLGREVGYDYVVMGENLALGNFSDANDLLKAWMASPGHRANILNPSYQDIGVYAAQGTYQGQTVWFAVQHFGTERTTCPSLDNNLKASIDAINANLQAQQNQITELRNKIEDPNHVEGQAYSDLITQFNQMVATYNTDLTTSQQEINIYNKQVASFNKCLAQYQTSSTTSLSAKGEE